MQLPGSSSNGVWYSEPTWPAWWLPRRAADYRADCCPSAADSSRCGSTALWLRPCRPVPPVLSDGDAGRALDGLAGGREVDADRHAVHPDERGEELLWRISGHGGGFFENSWNPGVGLDGLEISSTGRKWMYGMQQCSTRTAAILRGCENLAMLVFQFEAGSAGSCAVVRMENCRSVCIFQGIAGRWSGEPGPLFDVIGGRNLACSTRRSATTGVSSRRNQTAGRRGHRVPGRGRSRGRRSGSNAKEQRSYPLKRWPFQVARAIERVRIWMCVASSRAPLDCLVFLRLESGVWGKAISYKRNTCR